MKILITGINGFIGRHLYNLLIENGHEQISGMAMPAEDMSFFDKKPLKILRGDLSNPQSIVGCCEGIDLVIHLAARVTDWGVKKVFYDSIYHATENLLKEASQSGVKRFVYTSSVAACGMGRHLGYPDEASPVFKSGVPYNDAKTDTERLVEQYQQISGMGYTIIRPTNVTGPNSVWVKDPIARMGEWTGLPLLDGGRYHAALVDVSNLVDGFYKAAFSEKALNQTYFLMDDWEVTWKEYLNDLGRMVGRKPKGNLPFRMAWYGGTLLEGILNPLGVRAPLTRLGAGILGRDLKVNTRKAREELGWSSTLDYASAMQRIEQWIRENPKQIK